jgi:mRNA (2'-O-methyladenosine-N6-)-methyltransferase
VAIGYESLSDDFILSLPIPQLQKQGFIFIWYPTFAYNNRAINAKYRTAARCIKQWGYTLVDEIVWIKKTVNGKIAKGHGYYLQHAKENCLVGVKVSNSLLINREKTFKSATKNLLEAISFGAKEEVKAKNQKKSTMLSNN